MSWLPSFLNPWWALAAAGGASALLLVLYFLKLRRREMEVSSTLLWRKAIQDLQVNAPFQRLRRNLLLFLQLLILLLLCLALSRPVSNYTKGPGKMTVLLIDRSASMNATDMPGGKTRLEEAKRQAKELVGSLDRGSVAMVIAFDESAQTVQRFTSDAVALKQAIDSITPTDRPTRLKLAYQLAEAQMNFNPDQLREVATRPDVRVYSDGRVLDGNDLTIRGDVRYEKIGTETAGNIAVVALSARRNYERPTQVQVFARLANYGPEVAKADVQLYVDGRVVSIGSTVLLPDRWTDGQRDEAEKKGTVSRDSVEFPPLELTTSAVIRVEQMNKQGDCLAADDSAMVVVPPPKTLSVLLVSDGDYFLERALNSLNLQKPEKMLPSAYEKNVPTTYDVIIFDRHSPAKLPKAGSFVYFGAVPPGTKLKAVTQNGVVQTLDEASVLDWKRDHPILRGLSLQKLYIGKVMGQAAAPVIRLSVPPEAETLVDGNACPLVVLHREGASTHLVVAFDLMQSNWPLKVSFPVFLHDAMQYMAVGAEMDVRQSLSPGATPRIPRANVQKLGGELKAVNLIGPEGTRSLAIPEAGDLALPALDQVGLYATQPAVPQFEKLAVSLLDGNESNLIPAEKPPGNIGEMQAAGAGKSRLELWWWIVALGTLPMLFIEWWVYTRRVHL